MNTKGLGIEPSVDITAVSGPSDFRITVAELIRILVSLGSNELSVTESCLYYRGRVCMSFSLPGSKTVCNREVSIILIEVEFT